MLNAVMAALLESSIASYDASILFHPDDNINDADFDKSEFTSEINA